MEEPIFAVPAFDANGMPLQPPEQGTRRDSLSQRPRRSEASVFAPNAEFTMTTPVAEQAASMHPAPSANVAPPAPVYQMPLADLQPPAPVYEVPQTHQPSSPVYEAPLTTQQPAPVYEVPQTPQPPASPPPAPVYELSIDAPSASWDSAPQTGPLVPPHVYDVSDEPPA